MARPKGSKNSKTIKRERRNSMAKKTDTTKAKETSVNEEATNDSVEKSAEGTTKLTVTADKETGTKVSAEPATESAETPVVSSGQVSGTSKLDDMLAMEEAFSLMIVNGLEQGMTRGQIAEKMKVLKKGIIAGTIDSEEIRKRERLAYLISNNRKGLNFNPADIKRSVDAAFKGLGR